MKVNLSNREVVVLSIVITAIVVGTAVFVWQSSETKNQITQKTICLDSDVNEKPNDIYIKGSVTYTDKDGVEITVYDECSGSKTQVNEKWCYESPAGSGNYVIGNMIYDCPNNCFNGACIKLP